MAETERPDFALMDIRLDEGEGEMDGIHTAQELRTRFDIPSIYLTAYADEELLHRARQTAPYGYLVKPLQELTLRSTLEMAVAKRQVDTQLKAALQKKEALMKDILHRTKNNMNMIDSLLNLQSNCIEDAQVRVIFKDTGQRVRSMAMVQERLYKSQDFANLDLKMYLCDLAAMIFGNYEASPDKLRFTFDVDDVAPVVVGADTAIYCGLLLNELLTNAMKYAFPGESTGKIKVALHTPNEGEIEIGVSDTGVGLPEDFDVRKTNSLGLQLVQSFTEQLRGTLEIKRNQGTEWLIRFQKPPQRK